MLSMLFIIFNTKSLPHPEVDWPAFKAEIEKYNAKLNPVFNPLSGKYEPVVNMKHLERMYSGETVLGNVMGADASNVCSIA